MMTVNQIVRKLEKYPGDMEVMVKTYEFADFDGTEVYEQWSDIYGISVEGDDDFLVIEVAND